MLALLVSVAGLAALAGPAAAAPVYEIDGAWVNAPATIERGTPVVAEWRINVNDDQPAPSNEPVDNVTATFAVQKAFFDEIPDMCLTTGVTPVSKISTDGLSLTCNFGPVKQGTALIVQTPVVANGVTNERIQLEGTSPSGEKEPLPPILIRNPFSMDMQWDGASSYEAWDDINAPTYVDVDLEWSLRLGEGSDPGPASITQRFTVTNSTGSPVQIGTHPNIGQPDNWGVQGCTEFDLSYADGHPYSSAPGSPRHTNFVDSCTLTQVSPGVYDLTLTGINYDLLNVPDVDSFGNPLPTDWAYVASGMVWFRVITNRAGSLSLDANEPTYTAPTGQQSADLPGNNTSNKTYTLPGGFSSAYNRPATGNGGNRWDNKYQVAAGTRVWTDTTNWWTSGDTPAPTDRYGVCQVLDTAYVDFDPTTPILYSYTQADQSGHYFTDANRPGVLEYYTGGVGDPNTHNCGTGTWSTTLPPDPTTVSAVRWSYPASEVDAVNAIGFSFRVPTRIEDDVAPGQDVWSFGSFQRAGTWTTDDSLHTALAPTPGLRYPFTNGRRDLVVIVTAIPAIKKASARSTITPGVPVEFTLTYSANGAGSIPPEVDDYTIVDTLPAGMTYEPGSATPEPATAVVGGRQVLTWEFDGVTTNVQHPLTYEAVADDSIAPGTPLTNTAVSSLGGRDSAPASKTVTTTTNGFTDISKTTDTPFIPNVDGSGDGEGSWTVTLRSNDPLPQAYTDVIDILPYEGDFRGTDYDGSYKLTEVEIPAGSTGTVYYASAHPATLSDDPEAPANGGANTPSAIWSTTFNPNATAVRVIGPALNPGQTRQFRVHIATDGAMPKDVYVNRAQGRAEHTRLVMRTSAPMSVAAFYSANLKKFVQDA
ncbi:hypothetical protein, partial [Nocardioides sp. LHG3406-4]|uniref:hypothetical protein n=1 Tax=Nocardioides sp. LHG3406-4 TaxID=2804575 RepID=UPI003CFB0B6F